MYQPDGMETSDEQTQREALEWGHAKSAEAVGQALEGKSGGSPMELVLIMYITWAII